MFKYVYIFKMTEHVWIYDLIGGIYLTDLANNFEEVFTYLGIYEWFMRDLFLVHMSM